MKPIKYSLVILLVFLALLFTGLLVYFWQNNRHYKNIGEFRNDIDEWSIIGSTDVMARNILLEKGYKCSMEHSIHGQKSRNSLYILCYRELLGFPCDQRLQVWLSLDANHLVDDIVILQSHGQLPAYCL